jgi:hypothetical protein
MQSMVISEHRTRLVLAKELHMTVSITKTTVRSNVGAGTIVGVLTGMQGTVVIPSSFTLVSNPNNYFAISGDNLVTAQSGPLDPGEYLVSIAATPIPLSACDNFIIKVTASAPSLPVPVSITITPSLVSVPDNTLSGVQIATIAITTSNGSPFSGALAITPEGYLTITDQQSIVLSRDLDPRDEGTLAYNIIATENGKSLSATLSVEVTMPYRQPPQPE